MKEKKPAVTDPHKIVMISIFESDLAKLDEKVAAAKKRGIARASRSSFIREAVDDFTVENYARARRRRHALEER